MTEIKWEEPPAEGRAALYGFAQALRERPGQWALVGEDCYPTLVPNIKTGANASFRPAGAFEARGTRGPRPGRSKVWARFVGDPE